MGSCQLLPQNQSFLTRNTLRNSISDTVRNFLGILPRNITYLGRKTTPTFSVINDPLPREEAHAYAVQRCWALCVPRGPVSPLQAQAQPNGGPVGDKVGHSGLHLSVLVILLCLAPVTKLQMVSGAFPCLLLLGPMPSSDALLTGSFHM